MDHHRAGFLQDEQWHKLKHETSLRKEFHPSGIALVDLLFHLPPSG